MKIDEYILSDACMTIPIVMYLIRSLLMDLMMLLMLNKLGIDSITMNGTTYERAQLLLRVDSALAAKKMSSPGRLQWIRRCFIVVSTLELLGRFDCRLCNSSSEDKVGWRS